MRKTNWILREILFRVYEQGESFMSQRSVAESCGCSLDAVNRMVSRLEGFGAVERKPFGFRVLQPKKILTYWASTRNLWADLVYSTYSPEPAEEILRRLSGDYLPTSFWGCREKFPDLPPVERVHVYGPPERARALFSPKEAEPNLFVFKMDPHLSKVSPKGVPLVQLYVDLWQLGEPLAERYLMRVEETLERRVLESFKRLVFSFKEEGA